MAERPLSSADARLSSALLEVARRLDLTSEGAPDVVVALRARLRDLLRQGHGDAARAARTLGLSERTLHRRLQEAGYTFQRVLDEHRAREAERSLEAGRPLAEIASDLGYSDQTAFTRAFRRWTGTTPSAWRTKRRRVR